MFWHGRPEKLQYPSSTAANPLPASPKLEFTEMKNNLQTRAPFNNVYSPNRAFYIFSMLQILTARTADTVRMWSLVRCIFFTKLVNLFFKNSKKLF